MPFDGIVTKAIIEELGNLLIGGKIRKIYQPEKDEIRITINKNGKNYSLLINSNSNSNRIHITKTNKPNPEAPPMFCMSLRKHLNGARLNSIEQISSDRVIKLKFNSFDELGRPVLKNLIVEITGHNSNIILTEEKEDSEIILDSLKKVGNLKSRYRNILPGLFYQSPPGNKHNLFNFNKEKLKSSILKSNETIEKFFLNYFFGLSPILIREICYSNNLDPSQKLTQLTEEEKIEIYTFYINSLENLEFKPYLLKSDKKIDFYVRSLNKQYKDSEKFETFSELLENYFTEKDKINYFRQKSLALKQNLDILYKKNVKKLQNLDRDLKKALNNEKNKLYGDLITSNIWKIQKGQTKVLLTDYSDENLPEIEVPLKINETPSQNAQRFYKKYNKNKRAQKELTKQIVKTKEELDYLESLLISLSVSNELEELNEIQNEFSQSGLKGIQKNKSKKINLRSKPLHFKSSEGFDIYVGKNNYQNDYITTKLGVEEDCWLHVKDAPGSHVLIAADNKFIPEQTVLEAGALAAYYSKLSQSENVPVDYVEFKYVKKPNKSKPGFVTFTNQNTMFVYPDNKLERVE